MRELRSELFSPLQIATLLIFILYLHGPASLQTGSSLPTFSDSTPSVPCIDVEGYGSLELKLQLTDPAHLSAGGIDTHDNNDHNQSLTTLLAGIDHL